MEIRRIVKEHVKFETYAENNGFGMIVLERNGRLVPDNKRFKAFFDITYKVCMKADDIIGYGKTEEEAIEDFAKKISGESLIIGVGFIEEREVIHLPDFD